MKLQLLALFALAGITLSGAENLLLAHTVPGGAPEGRKLPEGVEVTESDDGKLNLKFTRPGSVQYTVYITPELRRLYLSAELKPENLVPGNEDWKNGRLALRFFDRHWKQTGGWPTVFGVSGTHPAQHCSRVYDVPPNAEILLVEPSHFGASGTMEFRNLVLTPAPENLLLAPNPGGIAPEGIDKAPVHATVNPDGTVDLTIDGRGSHRMHVPVRPEWGALKLSMKMKVTDVLHGDAASTTPSTTASDRGRRRSTPPARPTGATVNGSIRFRTGPPPFRSNRQTSVLPEKWSSVLSASRWRGNGKRVLRIKPPEPPVPEPAKQRDPGKNRPGSR